MVSACHAHMADKMLASPGTTENAFNNNGTMNSTKAFILNQTKLWDLRLTAVGTRCADHVTPLYPQKLALTSPTGGGRSVGIVRVRTKATEFSLSMRFNA